MPQDESSAESSRGSDAEFLELERLDDGDDERHGHFRFVVTPRLSRHDGMLYGGSAIAASVAVAEIVTNRHPLWTTTQFVATASGGSTIDVAVDVLAQGRRTAQTRVTGTIESGEVMFASLGANGAPKATGLSGRFEDAPTVSEPGDSAPTVSPFADLAAEMNIDLGGFALPDDQAFSSTIEYRVPTVSRHPDPGPGRNCWWVRRRDREPITPAIAAYVSDAVPMSIARAGNILGGGVSLDNTIRIGDFTPTEWLLLDMRPQLAVGGYGHGTVHLWNESMQLVGTASQSASILEFIHATATDDPVGDTRTG